MLCLEEHLGDSLEPKSDIPAACWWGGSDEFLFLGIQ